MRGRLGRASRRASALGFAALALLAVFAAPASALPPLNDHFAAGQVLTGATATATGTNVDATKETAEPNHAGYTGGRSVWYRWTAPTSGSATVDTFGSSFDTLLGVYTGETVGGLHHIASNDQFNGNQSRVRFAAVAGQEYRIAVDGWAMHTGSITLNASVATAPANDNLADAAPLSGATATATGSNLAASKEPGEPNHASGYGGASVWWTWTAPSTGGVTISTAGSSFNTVLAAYTGTTPSGLVAVAANGDAGTGTQSSISFRAIAGTTYQIAVDGQWSEADTGSIALSLNLAPPPSNDDFAAATTLASEANVTATGTNVGSSAEPGEPAHYAYQPATQSVWYSWTAPSDGSLTLRADAGFNRALAVYTGTQVSGLTRVPNQAQNWSGGPEQIRVRVDAGVTYRIALDGSGNAGTFNLTLALIGRPANDDFADAATIVGVSADITGTNLGATQEAGEPIHEENYYDPSVWYRWTAPSDGGVTIDTTGSDFSTVVAVYTGTAVHQLSRVTTTRIGWGPEKRNFRAAAGVTYRIAIDGRGAQQGTFKLKFDAAPPPANDMFAAAQVVTPGDTVIGGNNIGATAEGGEPGGTAGATVWYRYTPTATVRARVARQSADFLMDISVYTGTSVDALTTVANETSTVTWRAQAGTTYHVRVSGGWRPDRGTFGIKLTETPPPANDEFDDAALLEGANDAGSSTNTGATRQPGEPRHYGGYGDRSVWWEWTAPSDGRATVTVSAPFDWVAGVYTGSSVGSLTTVRSADSGTMTFGATAGRTYRIAVDSWSDYYSGPIDLSVSLADAPRNDDFDDAVALVGSSPDATGTNVNATRQNYEPAHAGSTALHSVWYQWRAPASGEATIDPAGSSFDTRLAVYSGWWVGSLSPVVSSADGAVTFEAVAGTVYRIAVDGDGDVTGSIALSVEQAPPPAPANDAFSAAQTLTEAGTQYWQADGTNVGASKESGEPDHAGNTGGASVWYRWTAPQDGTLTLSTWSSGFDTLLGLYTGDAVGGLTQVAADDDSSEYGSSVLNADVTAGTTYWIAVDGKNDGSGSAQGPVRVSASLNESTQSETPADPDTGTGDRATDTSTPETRTTTAAPPTYNPPQAPLPGAPPPSGEGTGAREALAVVATVPRQSLARVLRRGLSGTARCTAVCRLEVSVGLRGRAAPRALAAAVAKASAAGAETAFVAKLPADVRRALKRLKAPTVTVIITARGLSGTATAMRKVTLSK
jgi:hypothetical protein